MKLTNSIIQNVIVANGIATTVKPPAKCFRCSIAFFDDTAAQSKGFVSSTAADVGYTFANYFDSTGSPGSNIFQGNLNQTIVLDRRGVGYMNDEFICQIKSTGGPCTFTFIWEVEI